MAFIKKQTSLLDFWENKKSFNQMTPKDTAAPFIEDFKNKKLSNTDINLDKIAKREDSKIIEQYNKFNLRDDATPNLGWFKQPFILRGIQRVGKHKPQFWGSFGVGPYMNRGGEIFSMPSNLVRGGIAAIERPLMDSVRIAKFMAGGAAGLLFIGQQIGLQLTAPKLEKNRALITPIPNIVSRATRVYNPATTLLQIAGMGSGLHLTRHGLLSNLSVTLQRYEKVAKPRNTAFLENNWNVINMSTIPTLGGASYENGYNRLINLTNDAFHSRGTAGMLAKFGFWAYLDAPGGPNSTYGLGGGAVKRVESTNTGAIPLGDQTYTAMSEIVRDQAIADLSSKPVIDFRIYKEADLLLPGYSKEDTYRSGINDKDITLDGRMGHSRASVDQRPNPNDNGKTVLDESGFPDSVDEMGIVNSGNGGVDSWTTEKYNSTYDLIPFIFQDIEKGKNVMQFRATLDSITDSFSPEWTSENYMGRAEPVWHYKGADSRKLGSGFIAYATNRRSLKAMYQKLNRLAGYTMPEYVGGNFNQMSAPLLRLTIGDYIRNQPGFLSSLTFNVENDVPWEVTNDKNAKGDVVTYRVPRTIKVDFEYTIIEENLVQRYKPSFGTKDWLDRV